MKISRDRVLLFVGMFFTSTIFTAHSYKMINRAKMEEKAHQIAAMVSRHNYIVAGLAVLGAASNLSWLIPFATESYYTPEKTTSSAAAIATAPGNANPPKGWSDTFYDMPNTIFSGVRNMGTNTWKTVSTTEGWKNIGSVGLNFGVQLGTLHILNKVAEKIQHPDTLRWYLYAHVPYEQAFDTMHELIKKLESEHLSHEQIRYNKIFLMMSIDRLTQYVQNIGSYMVYKRQQTEDDEKEMVEFAISDLVDSHKVWLQEMSSLLSDKDFDFVLISNLIDSYQASLALRCKHFANIEGESFEQRKAMKELLE